MADEGKGTKPTGRGSKATKTKGIDKSIESLANQEFAIYKTSVKQKEAKEIGKISEQLNSIRDETESIDLMARQILDLIHTGTYEFSELGEQELHIVYEYIANNNPIVGRIIDLHTTLPISKLRLQPPKGVSELVGDYVLHFFQRVMDRVNFNELLMSATRMGEKHGDAYLFVDDIYEGTRELQDVDSLPTNSYKIKEEDLEFIRKIDSKYKENPRAVTADERLTYLEKMFPGNFNKEYTGPKRIKLIDYFDIESVMENSDIDYKAVTYKISEGLAAAIDQAEEAEKEGQTKKEFFLSLGYSKGILALLNDEDSYDEQKGTITVDNDLGDPNPFIVDLSLRGGVSLIHRLLDSALEWDAIKRSIRYKVKSLGQIARIVSAKGASQTQIDDLYAEIQIMLEDPNHSVVVNYEIDWNEISPYKKEELDDLINNLENVKEELSVGSGTPDSLISGDSTYSGDNIKLEIMNTEFLSFKQTLTQLLEKKLFKPIALRKGFVTLDEWGSTLILYPKVTFSRISIRSDDVYEVLMNLYLKGSLPLEIILDLLNLDEAEVIRSVRQNLFTMSDPNTNDMISDMMRTLGDSLVEEAGPQIIQKLAEALNINIKIEEGNKEGGET